MIFLFIKSWVRGIGIGIRVANDYGMGFEVVTHRVWNGYE